MDAEVLSALADLAWPVLAAVVSFALLPTLIRVARSRVKGFKVGDLSVDFFQQEVDKLESTITTVGQFEQTRVEFLGKLDQIISKDDRPACIAYADIDGLRGLTRKLYEEERREVEDLSRRSLEREIRGSLIHRLALALSDAFYDEEVGNKHEIFQLNEPDVILVARGTDVDNTLSIARKATEIFSVRFVAEFPQLEEPSITISVTLVDPKTFGSAIVADRYALEKLARAKTGLKGRASNA